MSTPTPSLFKRIESDLRQRILSNELAPGEKLPSESEMINNFGVSRITVRQALSDLQAAGLIEKINGKGSFVSRPLDRPDLGLLTGFYEHMRARGHASRGKIISVRKITAPIAAALALGQPHDSPMTRVTMLKTVDGLEVAYGHVIGSNKLIQRLLECDVEYNDADDLGAISIDLALKKSKVRKTLCSNVDANCLPSILNNDEPFILTEDGQRITTEDSVNLYYEN